jgi:uncharacterized OB-fold protein
MKALLRTPTVEAVPFWQACREGRLQLQSCNDCRHTFYYPRLFCPRCGSSSLSPRDAEGAGVIYSFTQVHYSPFGDFWKDEVPYFVVQIDLIEGVRVLSRLICPPDTRPHIGQAVRLTFVAVDNDMQIPVFQPEARQR